MGIPLLSLSELIVDSEHKTAPVAEDGYPMIRTPNIGEGRFILDGVRRVDAETYSAWTRRAVPREGDLILAREAPVGNVAMIRPGMRPILGQRTVLIRPDRAKVEPLYLQYLMLGRELQHRMWSLSNGATVPHLNMKDIRELEVPQLPPLLTQRKAAAVLAAYDELIENNRRRIEILEEMTEALYREWFVNFGFPGHEDVPLANSPLGPIPEGWTVVRLGDVVDVNSESIRPKDAPAEIRYIDISSVSPGSIDAVTPMRLEDAPSRARRLVRHGDTIWSTVRPNRRSFALVLSPAENTVASTGFAVLRPASVPWAFLHLATSTMEFSAYLSNHARGAAYPAVNAEDFQKAQLVLPDARVLDQFAPLVEPMYRLRENLREQNANLRSTRDLLLPKLVSSEIDVSDFDIDTEWLAS